MINNNSELLAKFSCGNYGDDVPVYIGTNNIALLPQYLEGVEFDKLLIITDSTVENLYSDLILGACEKLNKPVNLVSFPAGEHNKTFKVFEGLCEQSIKLATRDTLIVAFGGGVAGNIAGFVAASIFRGIKFIHVPTTLIAQADSTLGIKQAINTSLGKNTVGAYYRPLMVINDLSLLETLSIREIECGLAESLKLGLSFSPELVKNMSEAIQPGVMPAENVLKDIVKQNILLKTRILNQDPVEKGFGLRLELGHTVGHAIERILDGEWTHGEAIGLGMRIEAELALSLGYTDNKTVQFINDSLNLVRSPSQIPSSVSIEDIALNISLDNKRNSDGVRFILPKVLGESQIVSGIPEDNIISVLRCFR